MKINEPNTDHERVMSDDQIIVSRTNLKGSITYCNKAFRDVSLYGDSELLGKNHNIVRHPDVPPAAFEDLWNDIQAGRPWVGIVKNRAKNGDFYWVEANVSPVFKNGEIVEFLSVRAKPSREQIAAAEAAYSAINSGQIKLGVVPWYKKPLVWLKSLSIVTRVAATQIIFIAMVVAALLADNKNLHDGLLIALAVSLSGFTLWFMKDIMHSLQTVMNVMGRIRDGHYRDQVDIKRNDEIGKLYQELKMMQTNMWSHLAETREHGDEAMRIKVALDNVATSVTVSDHANGIIYLNKAAQTLFDRLAASQGGAKSMLGTHLSHFLPDGEMKAAYVANVQQTVVLEGVIAECMVRFEPSPVLNERGEYVGRVTQWYDRTAEVAVEHEVDAIVAAAQQGDLHRRINLDDKTGFYYQLSGRINLLIDVVENCFNEVARVLGYLAVGDLSEQISEEYTGKFAEVKNSLNQSIKNLENMMLMIVDANELIRTFSEETVAGNNDLSQRAEQQASTLEETASSMEELTGTVKSNADNAQEAKKKSAYASMIAARGGDVVSHAIAAMDKITASSNRIAEIVGVIDEIAFQTNLLALNASVEAARAGEQGRGFAVVASEVRNLAQRSAAAAKEIKELIRDSVVKVNTGAELVAESGDTLREIVESVQDAGSIIEQIAVASSEQARGIEEINKAVVQLDGITQQNTALAEQVASSSNASLQKVAEMSELVTFFKTSRQGSSANVAASASTTRQANNTLDFSAARTKHLSWRTRLRAFLDGKESLTRDQAVSHKHCDLGKWLYSVGMNSYGHLYEMQKLEKIHADMHGLIPRIIGQKEQNDLASAEKNYHKMEDISGQIIELLKVIEHKVKQ